MYNDIKGVILNLLINKVAKMLNFGILEKQGPAFCLFVKAPQVDVTAYLQIPGYRDQNGESAFSILCGRLLKYDSFLSYGTLPGATF
jgi:hypothetical protein